MFLEDKIRKKHGVIKKDRLLEEKKEKEGGGLFTPMTKNNRAVPVASADSVPAVTAIPVLPKPITKSFTVTESPAARDAIVPDFAFRRR